MTNKVAPDIAPDSPVQGRWRLMNANPADVLARLPHLGRIMIILRANGATHERIGQVASATEATGHMIISSEEQDCTIELADLASVVFDVTSVMNGKYFPRIDLIGHDGEVSVGIVGMEGEVPFVDAFAEQEREDLPVRDMKREEREEFSPDDPGSAPFDEAVESSLPVAIVMQTAAATQRWRGVVEKTRPTMGFLNIMTSDFHLHLLGGTVSGWEVEGSQRFALDRAGARTGLSVEMPSA